MTVHSKSTTSSHRIHLFKGCQVTQRASGGFMNGTEMCNVKDGKSIKHWRENKTTKAFLEAVSLHTGIPALDLVQSQHGGHGHCTWLHPMVAIHLAMWISAEFAVRVMDWTFRFIIGDLTLVEDLVEFHEAANVGSHVKATITTSGPRTETEELSAYLTRVFGTCEIPQRKSDGYLGATQMNKVRPGKKFNDWYRLKTTKEFLEALSVHTAIPVGGLVEVSQARSDRGGGSWIHPKASIHFAMWISPEFAVQVMDWIFRLLSGDLTLVEDLVERHEAANAGVQVMATVTAAGPETSPESLSLLHRYNALQQEHEKLKVQVAQVTRNATTGEAELAVLRGRVLELTGRNGELAGQVVTLEADAQELRAAAAQMSADLERLEQDNAALQQDVGRKRQRLDGQEQALAMAAFMGRALYQEYLLRRAALEQTHAQTGPRAELLGAGANAEQAEQAEQPLAATKPARYIALHGVTADTGGRLHRIVRDLNRNTIDSIGRTWPSGACRSTQRTHGNAVPHMPPTHCSVSWRPRPRSTCRPCCALASRETSETNYFLEASLCI